MNGFNELFKKARLSPKYWASKAAMEFAISLNKLMQDKSMKNADLAHELGTSNAYITKVMRGDANFTIETMVKLAMAVDGEVTIKLSAKHGRNTAHTHEFTYSKDIKLGCFPVNHDCLTGSANHDQYDDSTAPLAA